MVLVCWKMSFVCTIFPEGLDQTCTGILFGHCPDLGDHVPIFKVRDLQERMDYDQTCTDKLLGHGQEIIRF